MPASAPSYTSARSRRVQRLVGTLGLVAVVCVVGSLISPEPRRVHAGSPPEAGVVSPKTWVHASRDHPVFWWIWAEVRDYLGEDEWRSLDVSWMPARARADLGRVPTNWRHADPYLLAGLWRLGLERETVLRLVAAHDGDPVWPLSTAENRFPFGPQRHFPFLWQPRLERWYRAQPAGETASERLKGKLTATWAEALTTKDVGLAATVVAALDARFGRKEPEARASDALDLVRETVSSLAARIRVDPREPWARVPIALLERFGLPGDVDLTAIADWARRQEAALQTETIPLPHPYDLHLFVLRLRRLQDRGPTRLPISGVLRDPQGLPIPRAWIEVEGYPKPRQSPPAWDSDVHGRFRIDDVPRGPVRLLVTTGDFWSAPRIDPTGIASTHATKVVETRAGVRDLEIVVDPGPQLLLRVVDFVPGPRTRGARVTWEEPDGTRAWRWTPLRDDGWARFVALPPDRELDVWAEAELDRRHVCARGLKPGPSEQRIERQEVHDIAGRVRASQSLLERKQEWQGSLEHFRVDVYPQAGPRGSGSGLNVAQARVQRDGTFRVRGLPAGTYRVHAGTHAGEILDVSKQVEAGTTDVVLDLDPHD